MRCCSLAISRRVASVGPFDSISATCRSICSSSCCAFSVDAMRFSADDANAAAPAQLFDPGDEVAIWKHIIAVRLHYHHEIALALDVKQHLGLALALRKKMVEFIHCRLPRR